MALNYTNSVPLHLQLKNELEQKIYEGIYIGKIPSERELMDEYYVSRSTVRQSIDQLVREGVLEKKRGKGTFVALKPIDDWLGSLSSTTETIERMGMDPGARLIESKIVTLSNHLREITGLAEAYYIKRVRYANHIPIGIETNYYPVEIGLKLANYDLNKESLYELLERQLDVNTYAADQIIKSAHLTKEDGALLNIPIRSSMLNAERKLVDVNGDFVEFENAYYRSDMYSFKIKLSRNQM
ncbi:GntR family transcriptional regulator [Oceanobacillus halotolerans]|uniref:GntR family transcriptional regulator n=1 Tax=Oceanobacillus halotolerans TaxID=2663380 RepID=UPI001969AAD5|nr:GntR family transcriptional regulator [Oceanobacillus halotolerans]